MTVISVPCRHDRRFEFSPERTALLAIDMQKEFFVDGVGSAVEEMRAIIPRVAELQALARDLGMRVIHTRESYRPDMSDVSAYRRSLGYVGAPRALGRFCIRGEPGHQLVEAVAPQDGEPVVDKPGFNAFHQSDLEAILRDAGIERLIFSGVTTQCCVHSTLRDAVDRGYWCLTVADCCAASDEGMHEMTLKMIASESHLFGWICDLAELRQAAR